MLREPEWTGALGGLREYTALEGGGPCQTCGHRWGGRKRNPRPVVVAAVLIVAQHRLDLLVIDLVVDDEVHPLSLSSSIILVKRPSVLRDLMLPTHQAMTVEAWLSGLRDEAGGLPGAKRTDPPSLLFS